MSFSQRVGGGIYSHLPKTEDFQQVAMYVICK